MKKNSMSYASRLSSKTAALLGRHEETLDGLQHYLDGIGLSSRCARTIAELQAFGGDLNTLVFFPDEFDDKDIRAVLAWLSGLKRRFLLITITANALGLRRIVGPVASHIEQVVLPKPAFGWTIANALRSGDQSVVTR